MRAQAHARLACRFASRVLPSDQAHEVAEVGIERFRGGLRSRARGLTGGWILQSLLPPRRRDLRHCPLPSRNALTVSPRPERGESVVLLRKSFLSGGAGEARRAGRDRRA